jgi:hemerythrin-like domain-containing protein
VKRHPALHPLSDDHHRALVLARRLRRSDFPDEAAIEALAREVRRAFESDLEPHFRVEETHLLPALEAAGSADLVRRTRVDHSRLRALVGGPWSRDTAREIGERLERHVRFEERVLFPEAEARLSEADLAAVHDAAAGPGVC